MAIICAMIEIANANANANEIGQSLKLRST